MWLRLLVNTVLTAAAVANCACADTSSASITPDDSRIGTWDGKTASAALTGPYEDKTQAEIPFGRRSFYMTPWRSYMDTWPAARLLECPGINFNVEPQEADATAEMLAEAGIRYARVEIGWGNLDYDEPGKLQKEAVERNTVLLSALRKHNIRPLILLNANSGAPCPEKQLHVHITKSSAAGARAIEIAPEDAKSIVKGYTGLNGFAYQTAYPLITDVDLQSGVCTLSAPLPKPLQAGSAELTVLKYRPFSGLAYAGGAPNPASQETLEGWQRYVSAVCYFARDIVGNAEANDSGFDLEVWNEYTFGSQFLDIGNYYTPAPKFKNEMTYSARGATKSGVEIILPMTIDFVLNPSSGLNGVGVISGFANQRPWDNGTEAWPGELGYSRHYYTDIELKPLSKANDPIPNNGPLSALGQPDGKPDGKDWNTVVPGSFFVPTENVSMPEKWHYGYKTEFITRDIQPFPGVMKNHYRYSSPGAGRPPQVWMTETNTWRAPWMGAVIAAAGCSKTDPRAIALSQAVGARALLRSIVFQSHKGVRREFLYAAKDDDMGFAFLPSGFYAALKANGFHLSDKVRGAAGAQWPALKRLVTLFGPNGKPELPAAVPRRISVAGLVEYKPRLVFKGDGTLKHPDRFNRDDFACLPFQLSETRYAIGYYVVTHNIVHEWTPARGRLDPARYTMPDQEFDLTLSNIRGTGATASAYDPLADKTLPVQITKATRNTISLHVNASDTPRFLLIKEAKLGVMIRSPRLRMQPNNRMGVVFDTSVACQATVSWGTLPTRDSDKAERIKVTNTAKVVVPLPTKGPAWVKIKLDFDGLTAEWPQWGYDSLGMLPLASPLPPNNLRVPPRTRQ